jgi:hypothetical protein
MRNQGFVFIILCLLTMALLALNAACQPSQNEADVVLHGVQQNIQKEMGLLDQDLAAAAKNLSGLDLTGAPARTILTGLLQNRPYMVDSSTIDRNAKIAAIEPAVYHEFGGSDISQQEHVIRLFRTLQPVLSNSFKTIEGFAATDLQYPIFSPNKEIEGSVSALFKPEILLDGIISPAVRGTSFAIWAMQTDGRIMYDVDSAEIGKNAFTDPLYQSYTQLIALGREIAVKPTGKGSYEFLDTGLKQTVKKRLSGGHSLYMVLNGDWS